MELAKKIKKKKPINGSGGVGARSGVHSGFGDTRVEGMFDEVVLGQPCQNSCPC